MSDEEYMDSDYDYSGPVDKRTRKSVVGKKKILNFFTKKNLNIYKK